MHEIDIEEIGSQAGQISKLLSEIAPIIILIKKDWLDLFTTKLEMERTIGLLRQENQDLRAELKSIQSTPSTTSTAGV